MEYATGAIAISTVTHGAYKLRNPVESISQWVDRGVGIDVGGNNG